MESVKELSGIKYLMYDGQRAIYNGCWVGVDTDGELYLIDIPVD